jgi:hypothetical protein
MNDATNNVVRTMAASDVSPVTAMNTRWESGIMAVANPPMIAAKGT